MQPWTELQLLCPRMALIGLEFERQVDAGAFLTFVTLVAGFLAWGFKTTRDQRRDRLEEGKNGALRLMLRILRDLGGTVSLEELREQFDSAEMKGPRKAYTGKNFRFKDATEFEAAVYRLDWEGKIEFVSPHSIRFRIDDYDARRASLIELDPDDLVSTVDDALSSLLAEEGSELKSRPDWYEVGDLVKYAMRSDPGMTADVLRRHLEESRAHPVHHRAFLLMLVRAAR